MKNKIEDALWQDYEDAGQRIKDLSIKDGDNYRVALEDRDKIRNELIKLEQMKNELSVITFGVTTGLSIYTIHRTFKFDETSTVTSTLGRNALNGVIPKLKR